MQMGVPLSAKGSAAGYKGRWVGPISFYCCSLQRLMGCCISLLRCSCCGRDTLQMTMFTAGDVTSCNEGCQLRRRLPTVKEATLLRSIALSTSAALVARCCALRCSLL
ncbi:hypothetical protein ACFX2I_046811 [Malus domestica]